MGYVAHNAIVVTSLLSEPLRRAHTAAKMFGLTCSEIVSSPVNGVTTFLVAPDGSKEGWSESVEGDSNRAALVAWLRRQRYSDGSGPYEWFEARYGSDDRRASMVSHEWARTPDPKTKKSRRCPAPK
jgi:hypothetical protein